MKKAMHMFLQETASIRMVLVGPIRIAMIPKMRKIFLRDEI
jgi:hypothetical protein